VGPAKVIRDEPDIGETLDSVMSVVVEIQRHQESEKEPAEKTKGDTKKDKRKAKGGKALEPKNQEEGAAATGSTSGLREEPTTPTNQTRGGVPAAMLAEGHTVKKRKVEELSPLSPSSTDKNYTTTTSFLRERAPEVGLDLLTRVGLPIPTKAAVLSIYENVKSQQEAKEISEKVPSPIGKDIKRTQIILPREEDQSDSASDWYVLSTMEEEDPDEADVVISKLHGGYSKEIRDSVYDRKGWIQRIRTPTDTSVLVIFKSRIANVPGRS